MFSNENTGGVKAGFAREACFAHYKSLQVPLLKENRKAVNFLLFLLIVAFFTVGADFGVILATELNGVKFITEILEFSQQAEFSSILDYIKNGELYTALLALLGRKLCETCAAVLPGPRAPTGKRC